MLVTNKGKLIRLPVNGIRIAGRVTQGVTLLNTEKTERVVSVTRVKKNIESVSYTHLTLPTTHDV